MQLKADQERVIRLLDGRDDSEELTLRQTASILPHSYPTLCRFREKGYLRSIRKGGRWIVLVSEIRRFNLEGNYNPDSSDSVPLSEEEKAALPLPIRTHPDGTVDLVLLSAEERDRLGTPPNPHETQD